jgi:hypothetical protein
MRFGRKAFMFRNTESLKEAGFKGFLSIGYLRRTQLQDVPNEMGIYLILRNIEDPPVFLEKSPGGHFKGRDPTLPIKKLRQNWVEGTPVLYIGKAGAHRQNTTLRKRVDKYLKFGEGRPVAHWGGRLIWQVANSERFLVCWKETPHQHPREAEKTLIAQFKRKYKGQRPFANLQD